jgi:hypothetical protein
MVCSKGIPAIPQKKTRRQFCVRYFRCIVKNKISRNSVPFRAFQLTLQWTSQCLGMTTFFRRITEMVPSIFSGIFSEQNTVPNPCSADTNQIYPIFSSFLKRREKKFAQINNTATNLLRNSFTLEPICCQCP